MRQARCDHCGVADRASAIDEVAVAAGIRRQPAAVATLGQRRVDVAAVFLDEGVVRLLRDQHRRLRVRLTGSDYVLGGLSVYFAGVLGEPLAESACHSCSLIGESSRKPPN